MIAGQNYFQTTAAGLTNIMLPGEHGRVRGAHGSVVLQSNSDTMYIQQLYTGCLAQAAYYIEAGHEAAVVDPMRNPEPYLQLARERGTKIKYVLETHFHADFVSGHIDLANKTGASIVFGPNATPGYRAHVATDGEMLPLGDIHIQVLHTPGHTIESACYMAIDKDGKAHSIFTGDTLFIGDVGRPDLLSGNLPKEELASILFDSLNVKIKTLPDDVVVYPGHGAGSACGKNLSTDSQSTIGKEKMFNYALKITDRQAFVEAVTTDQPVVPGYFFKDAATNKGGYTAYDAVLEKSLNALDARSFHAMQQDGVVVLDTRTPADFATGFVPGSLNIGLNGDFAVWAGTLIDPNANILLVAEPGNETEAIERLSRIGYDRVAGYLKGGFDTWRNSDRPCDHINIAAGSDIQDLLSLGGHALLDVRNRKEAAKDRIAGAVHIPLSQLAAEADTLHKEHKWLVYCAGGYRSMIAASFMKLHGFRNVASVEGGIAHIRKVAPELIELGMETE